MIKIIQFQVDSIGQIYILYDKEWSVNGKDFSERYFVLGEQQYITEDETIKVKIIKQLVLEDN